MTKRNIIFNKAGGTAGSNSVGYKLNLPADMVKALGVTPENRAVELELKKDKIIIKKAEE